MTTLTTDQQTKIIDLIKVRVDDPIAIYLFGSRAADSVHESSDFDVAVLPKEPIPAQDRWDIQQELAIALRSDVDLVDLRSATTVMRFQIVTTGELLYSLDKTEVATFEMVTMSMYTRFNFERREILEQIERDGRVYGR